MFGFISGYDELFSHISVILYTVIKKIMTD